MGFLFDWFYVQHFTKSLRSMSHNEILMWLLHIHCAYCVCLVLRNAYLRSTARILFGGCFDVLLVHKIHRKQANGKTETKTKSIWLHVQCHVNHLKLMAKYAMQCNPLPFIRCHFNQSTSSIFSIPSIHIVWNCKVSLCCILDNWNDCATNWKFRTMIKIEIKWQGSKKRDCNHIFCCALVRRDNVEHYICTTCRNSSIFIMRRFSNHT